MQHIGVKTEPKKKTLSERLKDINVRGIIALFFLIFNVGAAVYYYYMTMEVKRVTTELETRKDMYLSKVREHNTVKQDDGYKRYQAAKLVKESADMMDWLERTQYLIELIDKLYEIDQEDDTLSLGSFVVDVKGISLKGKVLAMKSIYREGGVIDTFKELEFVTGITIPGYEEIDGRIEFVLFAEIEPYDG